MNLRHSREVEAEAGVGRDHQFLSTAIRDARNNKKGAARCATPAASG
jgi:hypothetical protein